MKHKIQSTSNKPYHDQRSQSWFLDLTTSEDRNSFTRLSSVGSAVLGDEHARSSTTLACRHKLLAFA